MNELRIINQINSNLIILKVVLFPAECHHSRSVSNAAFISGAIVGSNTIVLPQSATDSDLTDIYLNENLQDYYSDCVLLDCRGMEKKC